MEISLEWGATRICNRVYSIFDIHQLFRGRAYNILRCADDTKLFRKTKEIGDQQKLQDYIDKLFRWSEKWQMLFNFGKCKCLHTGLENTGMNYEMGGNILSKTVKEKDLAVTMDANMKVSEQCRITASNGNQVLGIIRRKIYTAKAALSPKYVLMHTSVLKILPISSRALAIRH